MPPLGGGLGLAIVGIDGEIWEKQLAAEPCQDLTGNGLDLTLNNFADEDIVPFSPVGGTWSEFAIVSDGVNQGGSAGSVLGFEYTDDFSWCCWLQTTDSGGMIIAKQQGTATFRGISLSMDGTGKIDVHLRNTNTGNRIHVVGSTAGLNDGSLHHLGFSWAGNVLPVAADLILYVDGIAETPTVNFDNLSDTLLNASTFDILSRNNASESFRAATQSEVGIYGSTLTPAEFLAIGGQGFPVDPRKLTSSWAGRAAYWRLGENLAA